MLLTGGCQESGIDIAKCDDVDTPRRHEGVQVSRATAADPDECDLESIIGAGLGVEP